MERLQKGEFQVKEKFGMMLLCNGLISVDSAEQCIFLRHENPTFPEQSMLAASEVFHFTSFPGTEELGHLEMIGALVHQLTRNLKDSQIQDSAFAPYFVDHTAGVYPTSASGFPWSAASMQVKGDPIADLTEDLAAEQKARVTYDNILRLSDDPDVNDEIKFLREREVVHFQRFGEAMQKLREKLNQKNVYFMNPAFDM